MITRALRGSLDEDAGIQEQGCTREFSAIKYV
jgi:hypothetical protein